MEVLDAERRLVRVGGGATWGEVAAALDPHGWGLTSGDTADVGVGGLTLGGGIGWMVRRHGLAIDNLVGARVVTADGRLVTASADEHPDLFWALRGGGGNFGVVVDFDFIAQEVGTVHYGTVTYQLDDAADLITRWRDAMRLAPEELSSTLALMPQMPGAPKVANLMLCYAGAPGGAVVDADEAIEPLLELGTVTQASIAERRYAEVLEEAQQAPPGSGSSPATHCCRCSTRARSRRSSVFPERRLRWRSPYAASAARSRGSRPGQRRSPTATRRPWWWAW